MKLKAIAALIKKKRTVTLYDDEANGEQWLRVGDAIYLLSRLPIFESLEQLLTILDISEKETDKLVMNHCQLPDIFCFKDSWSGERALLNSDLQLNLGSLELYPARTSMGLRFYETQYMKPLRDMGDNYEIKERTTGEGVPYLVVKQGLCIRAIIVPDALEKTKMAEELQNLHSEMMTTMSYLATYKNNKPSPD